MRLVNVTLSTDTAAYANGDLIADTQVITDALREKNGCANLRSFTMIDQADQGVALDVYLMSGSGSFGTENAAPSIADADALTICCIIPIASGDWKDIGGSRVVHFGNINKIVQAAPGTRDLYIAVVNGAGTPTYAADSLVCRLGIEY